MFLDASSALMQQVQMQTSRMPLHACMHLLTMLDGLNAGARPFLQPDNALLPSVLLHSLGCLHTQKEAAISKPHLKSRHQLSVIPLTRSG